MTDVTLRRSPDAPHLEVSRVVAAEPRDAWALLTDTHRWTEWGPTVTGVVATDRFVRRGSRGRVRTPAGVWLPFEVTDCVSFRWRWTVAGVRATGHRVEALDEGCRVVFEVPLSAWWYVPVCRAALRRIETLLC